MAGKKEVNPVRAFISVHIVSWLIEILILGSIGFYSLSEVKRTAEIARQETRETAQLTRSILSRFDDRISTYAAQKTEAADKTATDIKNRVGDLIKRHSDD